MRRFASKPLVRYRFKDQMNCVFFKNFHTDREARLWFERYKTVYALKELNSVGIFYNHGVMYNNIIRADASS